MVDVAAFALLAVVVVAPLVIALDALVDVAVVAPPLPPVPPAVGDEVAEQAAITVAVRLRPRSNVPYYTVTPGNPCERPGSSCCVVDLFASPQ